MRYGTEEDRLDEARKLRVPERQPCDRAKLEVKGNNTVMGTATHKGIPLNCFWGDHNVLWLRLGPPSSRAHYKDGYCWEKSSPMVVDELANCV